MVLLLLLLLLLETMHYCQVSKRGLIWGSMLHGHFRQTTMALPTRVEPGEPHKL
jgi:hypothetical protein